MAPERIERRLTAILAADVAGYSRLMGVDEEGTLETLNTLHKSLIDPKVAEYGGRVVKTTGDGLLVEFMSAVAAVRCAIDIQRSMRDRNANLPDRKRIDLRIGVNIGDVIVQGDDIFGEGVNIAARLESISEAGSICISRGVYEQVQGKIDAKFDDAGNQELKNILHSVRVYRMRPADASESKQVYLGLPDKPSIAVLAFKNISGDPEQEYFADGVVEEIITGLSRFKQIFVIARNSSFTYKGRVIDIKQVARELGVRYVLEGSVRKAANRVRITGQLIDGMAGMNLWADRFDGDLEDIFGLQERVAASVVGAIAPTLDKAEIERSARKTENLTAYDLYLRALSSFHEWNRQANKRALHLFCKATDIDPSFASAFGMAAWCYSQRKSSGWVEDDTQETSETARLTERAIKLGKDDAIALCSAGRALALVLGDLDAGLAAIDRALTLNENLAIAWRFSGLLRVWCGEPELALQHLENAIRLSPFDPTIHTFYASIANAHFYAGRFQDASYWAEKAISTQPSYRVGLLMAAASNALGGSSGKARQFLERLRKVDSTVRVSNLIERSLLRRPQDIVRLEEAMRVAGLPE